jgi:retron-type reverse transcriptase
MEAVVERSNMLCAYERAVANEGAPGVDGLTVDELKPGLKATHWVKVRQARLAGEYRPAAAGKVEIPKPPITWHRAPKLRIAEPSRKRFAECARRCGQDEGEV